MQMIISIASDTRRFLVSVNTRSAVLKADSEVTVEVGGVNKSCAMMESTGYVDSCDFQQAKILKVSNSESASISEVMVRVK